MTAIRIKARDLADARRAAALLAQPEHRLIGLGHRPDCAAQAGKDCACPKRTFWLVTERGGR